MLVRMATYLFLGTGLFLGVMWGTGMLPALAKESIVNEPEPREEVKSASKAKRDIGAALYAMAQSPVTQRGISQELRAIAKDPIVIANSHLQLIKKEDVPSQRDGVIQNICTEVLPEDRAKYPGQIFERMVDKQLHFYRPLKEGDIVSEGQLVALLDDSLPRAETMIKKAKLKAAEADKVSSEKTREESFQRWQTQKKLYASNIRATSLEDVRGAELTYNRYVYETTGKEEGIKVAQEELNQAKATLDMYEIRSKIPGVIKTISKKDGESIKSLDPVMVIINTDRLRVDGFVDMQYSRDLHKGMPVTVEPTYRDGPVQSFIGHRGTINGVAVSNDPKKTYIVSGSEQDAIAIVWQRSSRMPVRIYAHPAAVRVVECSPVGGEVSLCLTGDALGQVRLFDLNADSEKPLFEMKEHHRKAVTAAAFSPDGKTCATASDDGQIMLWDTQTGAFKYSVPDAQGHRTIVTSLSFTPQSELVSASPDTWIKVWQLGADGAQLKQNLKRQSSVLSQVGVSPDGKYYMAEHGREMRILSFATGATETVLRNSSQANDFQTLSKFSPDGRLALTCSGTEGLLQLWKLDPERSYEVRQLPTGERSPTTCAAIAPDGSFIVSGNKDGKVFVWSLPSEAEISRELKGVITSVDQTIDNSADPRVHIIAEMDNPKDRPLSAGDIATMVARPAK
jgi:WD40 repeat protein